VSVQRHTGGLWKSENTTILGTHKLKEV